jgi:prephenate dehydratase
MTAAIVVPLISVLLALILLVVLVAVLAVKYLKTTVDIAFSVKDKPGSLAAALKVFKDCNVNILGLNTHLHHAKFDRNAGSGYKFNYVHCMCTESQREFLEKELKAELKGGNVH